MPQGRLREAEPGAPRVTPAPAHPRRSLAEVTYRLQRSAGNAAVGRILARDETAGVDRPPHIDVVPPKDGDAADMDRAIREYFSNEDWEAAAKVLNGFDQAAIDTRVRGYDVGQRSYLADAARVNGADAGRIRWPAEFENAVFWEQWDRAAEANGGVADASADARLHEIEPLGVALILMHARRGGRSIETPAAAVASARSGEMLGALGVALGASDWDGSVALLDTLPDADLTAQLATPPRTPAQLFDIDRRAIYWGVNRVHAPLAKEPVAGLIRTEGLDRDLRAQIDKADWGAVTTTLEHYATDDERKSRLQWFHLPQVTALAENMRGGAVGVASSPIYGLVEARRIEKLGQEYTAAVNGSVWVYALTLLDAYNDVDLLPKAKEIKAKGPDALNGATATAAFLFPDDNHRVRRILAYIPLEGQTAAAPAGTSSAMTLGAPAAPGVAAGGGTVTAYSNVSNASMGGNFYGQVYTGADAPKTEWIQFIAREAEKFDEDGNSLGFVDTTWTASGQAQERRYSNPAGQLWFVDTVGATAPFYDSSDSSGSAGVHTSGPATTGMFDRPGLHSDVAKKAFDTMPWETDVDRVVMRAKFHEYLVRDNLVLFQTSMTVSWSLATAASTPSPTNTAGANGATDHLLAEHYKALITRFPQWTFYKHG